MKKNFSLAVSIFTVLFSLACGVASTTATPPNGNLVSTNQALSMQATIQQGIIETQSASNQGSASTPFEISTPPPVTATSPATTAPATAAPVTTGPEKLASGTGTSDFTLNEYLPVYNLHVVGANVFWPTIANINLRNIAVKDWSQGNGVLGERWFGITTPLPAGKYSVKSHGGAQWEIWSVGTPPFSFSVNSTGKTMQSGIADYFFKISRQGVYQVKMEVLSGTFVLYIGCGYPGVNQQAKDLVVFTQPVLSTSSYETNLKPGICFLEVATSYNSNNPAWNISVEDTGK
jgi:hypothetical protein